MSPKVINLSENRPRSWSEKTNHACFFLLITRLAISEIFIHVDFRHWRYHIMNLGLLLCLVHPDSKYSTSAVRYFLKLMVDETLRVRRIATKVMQFILLQNKPKFKKISVDPRGHYTKSDDGICPGNRPDNDWLLYNSSTVPTNAEEWNRQRYMHDKHIGFYTWPESIQVYAPPNEQPYLEQRRENLGEQEREIYNFFTDKANVALLIKYWSMEEKKGKDKFNLVRYSVIKVRVYSVSFLNKTLQECSSI